MIHVFNWAVCIAFLLKILPSIAAQSAVVPVIELKNQNFYQTVESWPSDHGVLMEFYAHWCPACKRFQPQYEKVAEYFNSEPRVHPIVTVARVDCANEVGPADGATETSSLSSRLDIWNVLLQRELCTAFEIDRFPTMKFGKPHAFMKGALEKPIMFDGDRDPASIVKWLQSQTNG
jgi:thiol-disulfide isomerase/thioredoxin